MVIADEQRCSNWDMMQKVEDWHIIDKMIEIIDHEMRARGYLEVKDERPWHVSKR